jgi:serine/threonine-protein kinase
MGAVLLTTPVPYTCPLCGRTGRERLCPEDQIACLRLEEPKCDPSSLPPGRLIGKRYRIDSLLGGGGSAVVFKARHVGTGQAVALKIARVSVEDHGTSLKRFFREARTTAQLCHPNSVRVFDFGQDDSSLVYIAMELLNGETLDEELHRRIEESRVFTEDEAAAIGISVLQSLQEAHDNGLVHRDLKPSNLFLHRLPGRDEPAIKVLDFGIAKAEGTPLTRAGCVLGTAGYMSPEQARNLAIDARADLYSLGVILFILTTGRLPFLGRTPLEMMLRHVNEPAPDLRTLTKTPLSNAFIAAVMRALSKSPDDRFADARAMEKALSIRPVEACRTTAILPVPLPTRTDPVVAGIVTLVPYVEPAPSVTRAPSKRRRAALALLALAGALSAAAMFGSIGRTAETAERADVHCPAPVQTAAEIIPAPVAEYSAAAPITEAPSFPPVEHVHRVVRPVPKIKHVVRTAPRPEPIPEPTREPTREPEPSVLKRKI